MLRTDRDIRESQNYENKKAMNLTQKPAQCYPNRRKLEDFDLLD